MGRIIEIVLPGLPPMNTADGPSRWTRYRLKKDWETRVKHAVLQSVGGWPHEPMARARVTITRASTREPDFDGLVQGGKFLLDGLVKANVLVDDRPSVIGQPSYLWEKAPRGMGAVKVRVEEVD